MNRMQTRRSYPLRSRFKAWLNGIVVLKCADFLRAGAQEVRRQKAAQESLCETSDECHVVELRQTIQEALQSVPDEQREVLELYYYAQLTLAEIAAVLGRNLNTVKYQFYRGHAQVGQVLGGEEGARR